MQFILNIGLNVNATTALAAHVVKQVVNDYDFVIEQEALLQSDTEPTLVLKVTSLNGPTLTLQGFYGIATDLGQDCIAVYRPQQGNGALVGPRAAKWGSFNPAYFFNIDGTRLAQPVQAAA